MVIYQLKFGGKTVNTILVHTVTYGTKFWEQQEAKNWRDFSKEGEQ